MDLTGHNKRFLPLTNNKSTWKFAKLLSHAALSRQIENDGAILNKTIKLGQAGETALVTVEDCAFPCLQWLMKDFNDNTLNSKEQYFNKKLCSTSAVTENAIGMLKVH